MGYTIVERHATVNTGEGGSFAFTAIEPGAYLVAANPDPRVRALNDIYHPGTTDIERASPIELLRGGRVELLLDAPSVPLATVSGQINDVRGLEDVSSSFAGWTSIQVTRLFS